MLIALHLLFQCTISYHRTAGATVYVCQTSFSSKSALRRPSLAAFCFGRNNLTNPHRNVGVNDLFDKKQNRFLRTAHDERDERRQNDSVKDALIHIQAAWRGALARRRLGSTFRRDIDFLLNQSAAVCFYSLDELRLLAWKFSVYYECPKDTSHLVVIVDLVQKHVAEIVNDSRWSVPLSKLVRALITCIASLTEAAAVLPLVKNLIETKLPGCISRLIRAGILDTLRVYVEEAFTQVTKDKRLENASFNECVDCVGIILQSTQSFENEEDRTFVYEQFFREFFCKKSGRIISDFLLPTLASKWKEALLKALAHMQVSVKVESSVYKALSLLECIRTLQVEDSSLLLNWQEAVNKLLCMSLPSLFDIFYYHLEVAEKSHVQLPTLESRSEDMDEPMLDTLFLLLNDHSIVEYLSACIKFAKTRGCSYQYGEDLMKLFYKISSYGQDRLIILREGDVLDDDSGDEDDDKRPMDTSDRMQLVNSLADDISVLPFFWYNALASAVFDESGIAIPNDAERRETCFTVFGSTCVLLSRILSTYFDPDFLSSGVAVDGRNPSPLTASDLVAFVKVLCRIAQTMIYDSCSINYGFPSVDDEGGLASRIRAACVQHAARWDDIFVHIVSVLWNLKQRDDRLKFCEDADWTVCDCQVNEVSARDSVPYATDGRLYAHILELHTTVAIKRIHPGYFVSLRRRSILAHIPFIISFRDRLRMLRSFIDVDREEIGLTDIWVEGLEIRVRRNHMFQDAYLQLWNTPIRIFKGPIRVVMYNSASVPESGVDGGGIFREFITEVLKQGFSPDYGFFRCTQEENDLYPNPISKPLFAECEEVHYFLGRLVGKAIYEGLQVEPRFALFYLASILYCDVKSVDFNYLSSYSRTIYNSLRAVANYEGDVEDLQLDFSITSDICGMPTTFELVPDGASVRVVNENKREYVLRVADFFHISLIKAQILSFRRGLTEVINFQWLSMFSPAELQIVINGSYQAINVEEWMSSTKYEHTPPTHPVVISFWKIVAEMTENEKSDLLKFVTSCSRPPLLGFESFHPKFTIQVMVDVTDRLPTSATCVNLLKLPNIPDALTLKEKLLLAIQSSSGFELS